MQKIVKNVFLAIVLLCLTAPPLAAETSEEKLQNLLKDLDQLIDKGEAQNLADPWFLQDLRGLAARYGEVWPVVLFDHQFDSRDTLPKAPWVISQGEMRMDWSRGLRSRVEASAAAEKKSDKEVAAEIIGGILGQALGTQDGSRIADPSIAALAVADVPVSNAFQMQAEISARAMAGEEAGALELGVYQSGNAGYRLVIVPRAAGGADVTLMAVSPRGTTRVVDSAIYSGALTDDQPYTVTLSRSPEGVMAAAIGETALISASDQSFRDAFTGLLIANRGGDYAVRRMTVKGTR